MTRRKWELILLVAAALGAVKMAGCGRSCQPGYDYTVVLQGGYSLDCTVTFVGPGGAPKQGSYDCPGVHDIAFDGWCTAQGDAPSLQVVQRQLGDSAAPDGYVRVLFTGSDVQEMEGWLGGASFSWGVSCGGTSAAEAPAQAIGQACQE